MIPLREKRGNSNEDFDHVVSHIGHNQMVQSSQQHIVA